MNDFRIEAALVDHTGRQLTEFFSPCAVRNTVDGGFIDFSIPITCDTLASGATMRITVLGSEIQKHIQLSRPMYCMASDTACLAVPFV